MSARTTKPYKTYAAIVSAFLSSLLLTGATSLPPVVVALITAVIAALAVYTTPNPPA